MTLQEELDFYKKQAFELQTLNNKLEQDNGYLEGRRWNLENKLKDSETERNKLTKALDALKLENKEQSNQLITQRNEFTERIKELELVNRDIKSKAIQLQTVYNQRLNQLYNQYTAEIAKARVAGNHQEIIDCLTRNNGNKAKTAKELGISRQSLYKYLERINEGTV